MKPLSTPIRRPTKTHAGLLVSSLLVGILGCGTGGATYQDVDGDGYFVPEDCNDNDASIHPGAGELCDGIDNDCEGYIDEGYDTDNDGYRACGPTADCDDDAAAVHPGAAELCDGIDNDCDGLIDEGASGEDVDGDGYCSETDCDDTDPEINPGASEINDGRDNDCDGQVDEGYDLDGDGYGPDEGGDCDDDNPQIHPGMDELCDGIDQDCDATIDEDFDADEDGYTTCGADGIDGSGDEDCDDSRPEAFPGAPEICNGSDDDCDGLIDEDTDTDLDDDGFNPCGGDCDDNNPAVHPGALELYDQADNDCNGAIDDVYRNVGGIAGLGPADSASEGRLGDKLAAGDWNGDGLSDFVASSPTRSGARGRVSLYLGSSFSALTPPTSMSPLLTISSDSEGDYFGYSVDLADINGDGYDDLIVGRPELGSASPPAGAVYIFFGRPVFSGSVIPLAAADVQISGSYSTEQCGTGVAGIGDINDDGIGDVAVGCPWYSEGSGLIGRVAIFFGSDSWSSSLDIGDADATILGTSGDEHLGESLSYLGDFNADGIDDLVVSSTNFGVREGKVSLRWGAASGWGPNQPLTGFSRHYRAGNTTQDPSYGSWMMGVDLDGDGVSDLIGGGRDLDGERGVLTVVFGAASPPLSTPSYSQWAAFWIEGSVGSNEGLGQSAAAADLDGDGELELYVGVPGWDGPAGGDQGKVIAIPGPLSALSGAQTITVGAGHLVGAAEGDALGSAVVTAADFNGDGAPDLVVSAPFEDSGGGNGGRVYIVPGVP